MKKIKLQKDSLAKQKLQKYKQKFFKPNVDQMLLLTTSNVILPPPISQIDQTLPEAVIQLLSKIPAYHRSMGVRLPDIDFVIHTLRTNELPPRPAVEQRGVKRPAEDEHEEEDEDDDGPSGVNRPPQNDIYGQRRAQKLRKLQ